MTRMTTQFKDGTQAHILSVNISETDNGLMAGTLTVATRHHVPCVLDRMEKLMSGKEKGYYCLPPVLVDEAEHRSLSPGVVGRLRERPQVDKYPKDQEVKALLNVLSTDVSYTIALVWVLTSMELAEHTLTELIQGAVSQLTFAEIKNYCEVYESVRTFSETRAAVKKEGKWGFIDYDGQLVIPCIYSKVGDFSEGIAYCEKPLSPGGKYLMERGFIDYGGKQVLSLTENYSGFGLEFDNKFICGLFKIYSRVHAEWINHEGRIVQKYQGRGYDGSGHDFTVSFGDIIDGVALGELSVSHVVYYSPQNEEDEQMGSSFFGAFTVHDITHLRFDVKRNIIEVYDSGDKEHKQ